MKKSKPTIVEQAKAYLIVEKLIGKIDTLTPANVASAIGKAPTWAWRVCNQIRKAGFAKATEFNMDAVRVFMLNNCEPEMLFSITAANIIARDRLKKGKVSGKVIGAIKPEGSRQVDIVEATGVLQPQVALILSKGVKCGLLTVDKSHGTIYKLA